MAKDANAQLDKFFREHNKFFDNKAPAIISKTAVEYYKDSFRRKGFDGNQWAPYSKRYKPKGGSLMVKSSKLVNSIREAERTPNKVVISAGNSKVPYARIHNEGGEIRKAARSETFIRNRHTKGKKAKAFGGMGLYKKGTTAGKGLTFKAHVIQMPKRQYMGAAIQLNQNIIARIKAAYKFK
ncbi:phage virion morphogenesis protein [Belliella sp. DSM 107340]|uniref:Phage virion morphogenesis protein n=1 Tax=Belliella calami TaxID=2923436 RepID=A0ABS9UUD8_9BACT|nr:phage virion morphogenesis protein [Belliella calami]MCH7400114.1 phage virion morphogenesis protein [Belliella calami]